MAFAECEQRADIHSKVARREWGEAIHGDAKKPRSGHHAASVMVVVRVLVLLPQVDERPGDQDQAFVEFAVGALCFEPEVFEDVVGFVVFAAIEAVEESEVGRVVVGGAAAMPRSAMKAATRSDFFMGSGWDALLDFEGWGGLRERAGRMHSAVRLWKTLLDYWGLGGFLGRAGRINSAVR